MTFARLLAFAAVWCCALTASAQVQKHDVHLFLDTDLVSYQRTTYEAPGAKDIESELDFGPGGSALTAELPGYVGLGLGYTFAANFVGQLHMSFARHQSIHERYFDGGAQPSLEEPVVSTFMLRPELEIPINPTSRAVFALLVGFDMRRSRLLDDKPSKKTERIVTGMGPVGGAVLHLFLVPDASLDLGVVATVDFNKAEGDGPFTDATNYRQAAVSLMLGLSLWP